MKTSSSNDSSSVSQLGCLYGVVRRIVCGKYLHNNDNATSSQIILEEEKTEEEEKKKLPVLPPTTSPGGLVARLMGLDPMGPDNNNKYCNIRRSRSTNYSSSSTESWSGFLSGHSSWATKSSQSFREVPTFLRKENEDFLLLSFGGTDHEEDEDIINGDQAEAFFEKKRSKKKKKSTPKVVVDFECSSSQNSSPVSVLDHPELDSPISGENKGSNQDQKPRSSTTLSVDHLNSDIFFFPEEEEIYNKSKEATTTLLRGAVVRAVVSAVEKKRGKISERRQEEEEEALSDVLLWRLICDVAEEDHKKKSDWVSSIDGKWEVAGVIGMDMMDSLLHETVAQLSSI